MKTLPPSVGISQFDADKRMLDRLRLHFKKYADGTYSSDYWEAVIGRFADLLETQHESRRLLGIVEDAHKMAIKQMEFAQHALRTLERQVTERPQLTNGETEAVQLHGE